MAERPTMPAFVPRTVASFERTATAVARRVAAPVRMLATRALSFADRLVGNWTSAAPTVGGFESATRPSLRAASRPAGMLMPRPWYEVDADEDTIWPQQAARAAQQASAAAASGRAAGAAATATGPTAAAAERGAAIARTTLTAPEARAVRTAAPVDSVDVGSAGDAASVETRFETAATGELRAAEALGLRAPIVAPEPMAAAPVARATTPLGRALAHAAWVDAQLRVTAPAARAATPAATGYVFIAPVDVARPIAGAAADSMVQQPTPSVRQAPPVVTADAPTATSVAAWSSRLPDPGLPVTMPTAIAQRLADFVTHLVGVQTARDAAPAAAPVAIASTATLMPTLMRARDATVARTYVELAAPATAAVSWRPGALGARVEQLGAHVDARVSASWGEPAAAPMATTALPATSTTATNATSTTATPTTAARMTRTMIATPAAGETRVLEAAARVLPASERTLVAPVEAVRRATGPARSSEFVQQLVGVMAARATAPLPVQTLIAQIARAAEAATVAATAPRTAAASARAPERLALTATTAEPSARAATTSATAPAFAPMPLSTTPMTAITAPGAVGRRAEQLGGVVGVRAASLSIDFVDPARLSMLTTAAPSMPTVAPAAEPMARETIMPSPRAMFTADAVPASRAAALTAEEWSLVATFPSAATAMQLAGAREAAKWSDARAVDAPPRPLVTAMAMAASAEQPVERARSTSSAAARGGVPPVYVAPTVAPAETEARLPGGRTPRGSFTWPKLAESAVARAEWTAPATVAAVEQAKQAAPGMPLWGSLPPLVAVAPSLAARTEAALSTAGARNLAPTAAATAQAAATLATQQPLGAIDSARVDRSASSLADAAVLTHEMVRGDAGATTTSRGDTRLPDARPAHAAAATRSDAPAMTLMTAAATREARAAARMGARSDGDAGEAGEGDAPSLPLTAAGEPARSVGGVSNVRPATAMPLMTTGPTARDGASGAAASTGPAARALDLARPFLRLVESGGGMGADGGSRSSGPRFFERPQPLVAGAPSSDSASRIVEALRSQPATASSDDRVSLADLTLIAIASANQQVAASPAGGGPSGGAAAAPAASSSAPAQVPHSGASANPTQEIEELARAAFDELQRLMAIARERSGDHG